MTAAQSKPVNTKTIYSTKAEKYAKYRWDYAPDAIEAIAKIAHLSAESTIADIGAGTGILTRHFVDKVRKIYAIEPDPELRRLLTKELGVSNTVSVLDGAAENTKLPDNSVDIITVAQAIHWFDPEPARRELMRILKDDGWLVLLRNYVTGKEQIKAIKSLMTEEYGADFSVVNRRPTGKHNHFYFGNNGFCIEIYPFKFRQNWEEFIGSLTTASYIPDEDHPLFDKLETKAREIFSQYSKDGYWMVEGETELIVGQPLVTFLVGSGTQI